MEKKASVSSDSRTEKKTYPLTAPDYNLLEEIGKGVSAVVYRAKCIPLNEFVAIKVLDLERCNSNLEDIRKEAQTMSLINHPNVVSAFCSFMVDQFLWVVMPFMAGGSCLHIMKAAHPDGFEEPIIAAFLKETLKALEYLHNQGHIHRDVKAGNILVDGNGAIKLGDFGVSACMFDTGDRQRSRSTFVGTPCWMAPEVMEQVHGYDFKADIWSFGITALELAHGHAPFSKYPPMKVLLMTLQNAPPGLDYERDRRFSKSFKEMVAMCLVKDPSKRPSAEKLLKHSFFKHVKSGEYIARTILDPLPPLWQRVRDVKMRDEVRLAEKKIPYGEQEARSQNEYKRGVSSWNFDLEDLKAQAALNEAEPPIRDDVQRDSDMTEINRASSPPLATTLRSMIESNLSQPTGPVKTDNLHGPVKTDNATDENEFVTQMRPAGALPAKASYDTKPGHTTLGKKEPKHFGRFDVFDDDPEQDILDSNNGTRDIKQKHSDEEREIPKKDDQINGRENVAMTDTYQSREPDNVAEKVSEQEHANQKNNQSSILELPEDSQEDRGIHPSGKYVDEEVGISQPTKPPKASNGTLTSSDHKSQKELSEEKLKGQAVFQKKGRFSVTSQDEDIQEHETSSRKNASIQTSTSFLHKSASVSDWLTDRKNAGPPFPPQTPTSGLNAATIVPQLQTLFSQTVIQQELIVNLMNSLNTSEQPTFQKSSSFSSKSSSRNLDSTGEISIERERDLLAQVAELQCRITTLIEEVQVVKWKNVQLERQLNAIFNKEEEERIRKEEAERDDG